MRPLYSTLIAAATLLVAVPVAHACSIASTNVTQPTLAGAPEAPLVRPTSHEGTRAAWKVGRQWTSIRPGLQQYILLGSNGDRQLNGVARRNQDVLYLSAFLSSEQGLFLSDDDDPATATCAVAGKRDWLDPKILVRETDRAVYFTAIARRTPGDRTGCVIDQQAVSSCDPMGFATIRLKAPVGDRRIVMQQFS